MTIEVPRGGQTKLADGTLSRLTDFQPDFTLGQDGKAYVTFERLQQPCGRLVGHAAEWSENARDRFQPRVCGQGPVAGAAKAGYKWRLVDFEKSPLAHVLSIKYDPYKASFVAWYIGGFGLVAALGFVFFYSHRRVWARIEAPRRWSRYRYRW